MKYAASYLGTLATFAIADSIWLGAMLGRLYRPAMGDMLRQGVNLPPAILFYLFYPVGLVFFAVNPALKSESWTTAALYGALFGLFSYGTYDLTNYATLRHWTMQLTVADMAWGTVLGALAASAGYLVFKLLP